MEIPGPGKSPRLQVGTNIVDASANSIEGRSGVTTLEPKVIDVLLALCARPGEVVSRYELLESVWGAQHGADESLTRAISLLRKALKAESGARHPIETFSKRGYRLNLPVSPLAIDSDEVQSVPGSTPRSVLARVTDPKALTQHAWRARWVIVAVAAMSVLLGTLLANVGRSSDEVAEPDRTAPADTIVVTDWAAINDLSGPAAAGARYLSARLSEQGLRVFSPTTSGAASAEFRLEGELRQTEDELVVGLRLESGRSGAVIWADDDLTTRADRDEAMAMAAQIGAHIVGCALAARRNAVNTWTDSEIAAWMRFCQATYFNDLGPSLAAAENLVAVLPAEPSSHLAVSRMAGQMAEGSGQRIQDAWLLRARASAKRALDLDPENIDALGAVARYEPFGEWEETSRLLQAVERQSTDHSDLQDYVVIGLLRSVGYLGDAWNWAERRAAASPSPESAVRAAWLQALMGQHQPALDRLDDVLRIDPNSQLAIQRRFEILALHGGLDAARRAFDLLEAEPFPNGPSRSCYQGFLGARLGRIEPDSALTTAECEAWFPEFRARLHGALGQVDQALALSRQTMQESLAQNRRSGTQHLFYPEMALARSDPRFWVAADEVGLIDFWLDYGRWPDFCFQRSPPIDCPAMAAAAISARTN